MKNGGYLLPNTIKEEQFPSKGCYGACYHSNPYFTIRPTFSHTNYSKNVKTVPVITRKTVKKDMTSLLAGGRMEVNKLRKGVAGFEGQRRVVKQVYMNS